MNYSIKKQNSYFSQLMLILCLCFSISIFSQDVTTQTTQGELTFETETIDYGSIAQNADGVRIFKFTNTGNAPVVISNVKTSCGCTVPEYKKTAILPNESSAIKVKYATSRIGVFSKQITVYSNAKTASKKLKIKGEILKSEI